MRGDLNIQESSRSVVRAAPMQSPVSRNVAQFKALVILIFCVNCGNFSKTSILNSFEKTHLLNLDRRP